MHYDGITPDSKVEILKLAGYFFDKPTYESRQRLVKALDRLTDDMWRFQELLVERNILQVCDYCHTLFDGGICEKCDSAGQDFLQSWEVA